MKKRGLITIIFLTATFIFSGIMVGCQNREEITQAGEMIEYKLVEDHYEVSAKKDARNGIKSIEIEGTYNGLPVTIPKTGFAACINLVSAKINGVTSIGDRVFMNCISLTTVSISGVDTITKNAFAGCSSLKTLTIGEGVKNLGMTICKDCSALETVTMEDVEVIGNNAFENCSALSALTFSSELKSIGNYAFSKCISLQNIHFPTKNEISLGEYCFSYAGLLELKIPANVKMGFYSFDHLAWTGSYSKCKCAYLYSTEPSMEYLGVNSIGYTWDRNDDTDDGLPKFMVYVPTDCMSDYKSVAEEFSDDAWRRCVTNVGKLGEFDFKDVPYEENDKNGNGILDYEE